MASSSTSGDPSPGSTIQYEYMFEDNKRPTKQLDALLRAIARHITFEIGDRHELQLTPRKLAAFYKAVGGNYDSIFVDMPESAVSYIWQVTGCQHTLQPTDDDFAPPTMPALTPRGFSRWESVEILLGPEEHVPFMQFAVKNWQLKHPESGSLFPVDLPADVFPRRADAQVDMWHKSCGERLTREAARDRDASAKRESRAESWDPKSTHPNARNPSQSSTPQGRHRSDDSDYFGRTASYTHIPERYGSKRERPARSPDRPPPKDPSPEERAARRRSFSDFAAASTAAAAAAAAAAGSSYQDGGPDTGRGPTYLDPSGRKPPQGRRHSHPRPYSSSSEDEAPEPVNSRGGKRRPRGNSPPIPSIRRVAPTPGNSGSGSGSSRLQRSDSRADDLKRRNGLSPLGSLRNKLSETVSSILPNGLTSDRSRPASRHHVSNEHLRQRKSREQFAPSRLSRSYSDLESDDELVDGPGDRRRRRPLDDRGGGGGGGDRDRDRGDRERDRERDRYRGDRDRVRDQDGDREDDWETLPRRDRQYARRPEAPRRTSSHADVDRRREPPAWEMSYKDRMREERRKWDRRPSHDDDIDPATAPPAGSIPTGSRRYAEPSYT